MSEDLRPPGLPDHLFEKGTSPLTRSEIRALTLIKAALKRDSIVYDIGAGTGSISIEAALLAPEGQVYAVEKDPARSALVERNARRLGAENIKVVNDIAPEALRAMPAPDRVIIGGSGGRLPEILDEASSKLRPSGLIVMNAVTIKTLRSGIDWFSEKGFKREVIEISIAREDPDTGILSGENPVFIIRGWKE